MHAAVLLIRTMSLINSARLLRFVSRNVHFLLLIQMWTLDNAIVSCSKNEHVVVFTAATVACIVNRCKTSKVQNEIEDTKFDFVDRRSGVNDLHIHGMGMHLRC